TPAGGRRVSGDVPQAPPAPIAVALFSAAPPPSPSAAAAAGPSASAGTRRHGGGSAAQPLPQLDRPYLAAPPTLSVGILRSWLIEQLAAKQAVAADGGDGGGGADGGGAGAAAGAQGEKGQQQQQRQQQQRQQQQQQQQQEEERGKGQRRTGAGAHSLAAGSGPPQLQRLQLLSGGHPLTHMTETVGKLRQRTLAKPKKAGSGGGGAEDDPVLVLTYRLAS
ncbi:hypothetical protein MNEG_6067, partial [Monoraphidium neglectum]